MKHTFFNSEAGTVVTALVAFALISLGGCAGTDDGSATDNGQRNLESLTGAEIVDLAETGELEGNVMPCVDGWTSCMEINGIEGACTPELVSCVGSAAEEAAAVMGSVDACTSAYDACIESGGDQLECAETLMACTGGAAGVEVPDVEIPETTDAEALDGAMENCQTAWAECVEAGNAELECTQQLAACVFGEAGDLSAIEIPAMEMPELPEMPGQDESDDAQDAADDAQDAADDAQDAAADAQNAAETCQDDLQACLDDGTDHQTCWAAFNTCVEEAAGGVQLPGLP